MDYASSVQAVALRAVTLDTDGTPLVGDTSAFVTDHFAQVSWTPVYKTGQELSADAGNGKECVYYKMPDVFQKVTLNVSICNPQPELYEKLGGGTVLQGAILRTISNTALTNNVATLTSNAHGFLVGDTVTVTGVDAVFDGTYVLTAVTANTFSYAKVNADVVSGADTGAAAGPDHTADVAGYAAPTKDEVPNEYGLGLEVWSRRIIESRPAGFWRWVFPFTQLRLEGERSIGNSILANSFSGEGIANTAFGTGPANDWLYGGSSAMQFARDATAPTGVNDYAAVA